MAKPNLEYAICYADGGCRGNQNDSNIGAWAYTIAYQGSTIQNSGTARNTTNNIMELTAIVEMLKSIANKSLPIKIHSDSSYVVKGINEWMKNWLARNYKKSDGKLIENLELWKSLNAEIAKFDTKPLFIHVAGHAGIAGNEEVDKLCNLAMDKMEASTVTIPAEINEATIETVLDVIAEAIKADVINEDVAEKIDEIIANATDDNIDVIIEKGFDFITEATTPSKTPKKK